MIAKQSPLKKIQNNIIKTEFILNISFRMIVNKNELNAEKIEYFFWYDDHFYSKLKGTKTINKNEFIYKYQTIIKRFKWHYNRLIHSTETSASVLGKFKISYGWNEFKKPNCERNFFQPCNWTIWGIN